MLDPRLDSFITKYIDEHLDERLDEMEEPCQCYTNGFIDASLPSDYEDMDDSDQFKDFYPEVAKQFVASAATVPNCPYAVHYAYRRAVAKEIMPAIFPGTKWHLSDCRPPGPNYYDHSFCVRQTGSRGYRWWGAALLGEPVQ